MRPKERSGRLKGRPHAGRQSWMQSRQNALRLQPSSRSRWRLLRLKPKCRRKSRPRQPISFELSSRLSEMKWLPSWLMSGRRAGGTWLLARPLVLLFVPGCPWHCKARTDGSADQEEATDDGSQVYDCLAEHWIHRLWIWLRFQPQHLTHEARPGPLRATSVRAEPVAGPGTPFGVSDHPLLIPRSNTPTPDNTDAFAAVERDWPARVQQPGGQAVDGDPAAN